MPTPNNTRAYQVSNYEKEHPVTTWLTQHVYNPVRAFFNRPVSRVLDNTYPFGYTNSRTTAAVQPAATRAVGNAAQGRTIAEAIGAIDKVAKAAIGYKTPAANAAYAFADLDLDNPANIHVADSLSNVMREDEPRWGRKGNRNNYRSLQKAIRGRIDLNRLHTARPQLYNTYMINDDYYVDEPGDTYVAADPEMRQAAIEYAKAQLAALRNKGELTKKGNALKYTVKGADPYLQYSNYTIFTDRDGSNPRFRDDWDFGYGPLSSKQWRTTKPIYFGDRIR